MAQRRKLNLRNALVLYRTEEERKNLPLLLGDQREAPSDYDEFGRSSSLAKFLHMVIRGTYFNPRYNALLEEKEKPRERFQAENFDTHVVRMSSLLEVQNFYPFASLDRKHLVKLEPRLMDSCFFISHKWATPEVADPDGDQFRALKKWWTEYVRNLVGVAHIRIQAMLKRHKRAIKKCECILQVLFPIAFAIEAGYSCFMCSKRKNVYRALSELSDVEVEELALDFLMQEYHTDWSIEMTMGAYNKHMRLLRHLAAVGPLLPDAKDYCMGYEKEYACDEDLVIVEKVLAQHTYFWYDYSVLPQRQVLQRDLNEPETREFRAGLAAINYLCANMNGVVICDNLRAFASRAWCLFELYVVGDPILVGSGRDDLKTCYDVIHRLMKDLTDDEQANVMMLERKGVQCTNGSDLIFLVQKMMQLKKMGVVASGGQLEADDDLVKRMEIALKYRIR